MQNKQRVFVIFTNVLHVPSININLISVRKLDLRSIYWRSNDQKLYIIQTHKEVYLSRVVGDLYVVIIDLSHDAFVFEIYTTSNTVIIMQLIE